MRSKASTLRKIPPMNYWLFCEGLADAPHILIAGATGAGKSVLIDDLLYSLSALKNPSTAAFELIDPKRVELNKWKNTAFCDRYAAKSEDIIQLLEDAVYTMEQRFDKMSAQGVNYYSGTHLYIIIDELADLMTTDARTVKPLLQRLLQLGRAAGIHVIAATQAPNRKVIPAELTLNFTHKIALRCDSAIESRQVINMAGAEALPLHGFGILRQPGSTMEIEIPMTSPEMLADRIRFWEEW